MYLSLDWAMKILISWTQSRHARKRNTSFCHAHYWKYTKVTGNTYHSHCQRLKCLFKENYNQKSWCNLTHILYCKVAWFKFWPKQMLRHHCSISISTSFHILPKCIIQYHPTEQVGSSGNTFDFYSEGAWFESWAGHQLSCMRIFVVFLSPSTHMPQ
jgi:hypothetical protein